jgi:hypothetical protein
MSCNVDTTILSNCTDSFLKLSAEYKKINEARVAYQDQVNARNQQIAAWQQQKDENLAASGNNYLGAHDNWVKEHPAPTPLPGFTEPNLDINSIVCPQCTKCPDYIQVKPGDINATNVDTAMKCVSKIRTRIDADRAAKLAEEKRAAEQKAAFDKAIAEKAKRTTSLIIATIVVLIIGATIGTVLVLKKKKSVTRPI